MVGKHTLEPVYEPLQQMSLLGFFWRRENGRGRKGANLERGFGNQKQVVRKIHRIAYKEINAWLTGKSKTVFVNLKRDFGKVVLEGGIF